MSPLPANVNLRECLYCRNMSPPEAFNREHAIPRALGKFAHAPVLDIVCSDCNKRLGDELINPSMRKSFVGWLRLVSGHTDAPTTLTARDLHCRIDPAALKITPDFEPHLQGMCFRLGGVDPNGRPMLEIFPQVGLCRTALSAYEFFTDDALADETLDLSSFSTNDATPALVVVRTAEQVPVALRAVEARGCKVTHHRLVEGTEKVRGELQTTVDPVAQRFLAYVALNYLAWACPTSIVHHRSFDLIRQYVLDGTEGPTRLVETESRGILASEADRRASGKAHLIVCESKPADRSVAVRMSLFGETSGSLSFRVLVAPHFDGIWVPSLKSGHRLDWESGRIDRLRRWPPTWP